MRKFNPVVFYKELRRRRVFRVAFFYGAGAFAVIGVCDWIFPQIPGLVADPDRAMGWVILAAIANFPIALIFGWLYDFTPEGIQRTPSFSELSHDPDTSLHPVDRWAIGTMGMLTVAFVAFSVIRIIQLEAPTASLANTPPLELDPMALGVLPLTDRSAGGENAEILAFGIHDTLLTLVSRIPSVRVISRTTMEKYKDTDKSIPEIAAELGVGNFLEGSVQRMGDQVRITVQLIRAPGDEHLWAETYDRELTAKNLFQVQSEIAIAVSQKMAFMLKPEDQQAFATVAAAVPTQNTEAYSAYALGRMRLRDRKVDGLDQAVEQFALAIELDPNYATAYSGLADACYLYKIYSGGYQHDKCPAELEPLVRKALALDDSLGEAWISLGNLLTMSAEYPDDMVPLQEAKAAFDRGLTLSPSNAQGYHWYVMLLVHFRLYDDVEQWFQSWQQGVFIKTIERGLAVDPLSVPLHYMAAIYPLYARSPDDAMWHARRMIEIAPDSPRGYETLAELNWSLKGRLDEAIRWESKAAQLDPKHAAFPRLIAHAYMALGDYDRAFQYFARAKKLLAPTNEGAIGDISLDEVLTLFYSGREQEAEELLTDMQDSDGDRARSVAFLAGLELSAGRADLALARYKKYFPQCFDPATTVEIKKQCPWELIRVFQEIGDEEAAEQWLKIHTGPVTNFWLKYHYPELGVGMCIFESRLLATQGQHDDALRVLDQVVSLGWRAPYPSGWCPEDWRFYAYYDTSLDSIRDDPRFKAAFAIIEADMAQQLKSVRKMERNGEIPTLEELTQIN